MAWRTPGSSASATTIELGAADDLFIAAQVAITVSSNFYGFDGSGTGRRVVILGTIAANNGGVMGASDLNNSQNWLQIGATGRLQGLQGSGFLSSGNCRIENEGVISSFEKWGIVIYDSGTFATGSQIDNSGLIDGGQTGIRIESNDDSSVTTRNTGTLQGGTWAYDDVSVNPHIDIIINSGTIIGDVYLGGGDDFFDGRLGTTDGDLLGVGGNDRIYAGVGNQALFGGDGNDTLMGGPGRDTLIGRDGTDVAAYSSATSGVVVSLLTGGTGGDAAGDVFELSGVTVEGLIGSAFGDSLTGNTVGNRLVGGAGNDTVNGGSGLDTLFGQSGQDAFVFNTAPGSTNYDRLPDYVVTDDRIRLDDAVFATIGPVGALAAGAFRSNTTGIAGDPSDRIIYNSGNGALYYDSDGTGGAARALIALLPTGLAMASTEFTII